MKSKTTAALLSFFLGGLGVDRFYLGYTGIGVLKLLTLGCCGILSLIDFIMILTGKLTPADGSGYIEDSSISARDNMVQSTSAKQTTSAFELLEKAAKLHEDGVLSDEEFNKIKAELLERM